MTANPPESAGDLWLKAHALWREGLNLKKAAEGISRAIEFRPQDWMNWELQANILSDLGRRHLALESFKRALGLVTGRLHNSRLASLNRCNAWLELNPKDSRVFLLKLRRLRELGRDDKAWEAINENPDYLMGRWKPSPPTETDRLKEREVDGLPFSIRHLESRIAEIEDSMGH